MKSTPLSITALFTLLIITFAGYAQLSLGISGGIARMKLGGDSPPEASYLPLTAFSGNGIIDVKLSPGVVLSFQPAYVQKGTKIAYEVRGEIDPLDSIDVSLTYLSLPVLAKVFTHHPRWYVSSGLELSYLLDSKYSTSSGDSEINEGLNDLDLAMNFGVGFILKMRQPQLFMEFRYSQSLTNLVKEDYNPEFLRPRIKNNGFLIYFGVLFQK